MSTLKYSDFKINPIFPDVMTSQADNLSQECFPHFHLDFDITLVTSGVLQLKVGNVTNFYSKNQICIINPGMVHCGEGVGSDLLSTKNIRVKPEFMLNVAKMNHADQPETLHFDSAPIFNAELRAHFQRYFDVSRKEDTSPQVVSDTGWDLFLALVQHSSGSHKRVLGNATHGVSEMDLMKEKVREKLNIQELATKMNLSEYYFIKKFKKQYGITPYSFFMQMKLESAFRALVKGRKIKEVAYEFGYSDQAHLNRLLKKHYGYTPIEVRKITQEAEG